MNTAALLVIDAQNDFMDHPDAALPVPGALADMDRLARFIRRFGSALSSIVVSMDSHSAFDIAHPSFWVNGHGYAPAPFTVIPLEALQSGMWRPRSANLATSVERYLIELRRSSGMDLIVWPEHCLMGSWGHGLEDSIDRELHAWSRLTLTAPYFVFKGTNPLTEHYSMFKAEVPMPLDPGTLLDFRALAALPNAGDIYVAGEALSHCVAQSVRDLIKYKDPSRIVLLVDCMSPVAGFETVGQAFIDEVVAKGVRTAISTAIQF